MPYFVDFDGRGILSWDMFAAGIILEDGRVIPFGHNEDRVFSTHPDENENMECVGGVYHHKGRSLLDPDRLVTPWDRIRCGHSACSQNYIDTGDQACTR